MVIQQTDEITTQQQQQSTFDNDHSIVNNNNNNKSEPTSESSHQMRDRAYEICRKYLSGEWNKISSDDMIFKTVSGGLSNLLYYCSLPSTHTPMTGEPSQVLLRMYGQLLDKNDTKITDSVITMLLSERKLGPKLYGIFPGGRLEEYIPARAMSCDELSNPIYSAIIARKLAIVHHLNVPINKEPTWLNDTMKKWLQQVRNYDSNKQNHSPSSKQISTIEQELIDFDYEHEIDYMFKIIEQNCKSPVVFCHNDLQEGNILLPSSIAKTMDKFISDNNNNNNAQNSDNGDNCKNQYNGHCNDMIEVNDDHIVFIDFEFCSYNYRGFDLANHFIERMFDYSNEKWPHFFAYMDRFPNDNDKLLFIREYLKQNNELMQQRQQPIDKSLDNEQNLIKEIDFYALASHLLWTLWSINNARTSKISFGYLEYGQKRLEAYQLHKKYLNEKYCLNI